MPSCHLPSIALRLLYNKNRWWQAQYESPICQSLSHLDYTTVVGRFSPSTISSHFCSSASNVTRDAQKCLQEIETLVPENMCSWSSLVLWFSVPCIYIKHRTQLISISLLCPLSQKSVMVKLPLIKFHKLICFNNMMAIEHVVFRLCNYLKALIITNLNITAFYFFDL